jgi:hypothetical protein
MGAPPIDEQTCTSNVMESCTPVSRIDLRRSAPMPATNPVPNTGMIGPQDGPVNRAWKAQTGQDAAKSARSRKMRRTSGPAEAFSARRRLCPIRGLAMPGRGVSPAVLLGELRLLHARSTTRRLRPDRGHGNSPPGGLKWPWFRAGLSASIAPPATGCPRRSAGESGRKRR